MDEGLRAELLRRAAKDQAPRKPVDVDAMRAVDGENLPWLKGIIAEHGWPGASLVGEDGAHAAWLLAQHAVADHAFQRRCLELLTAAVEAGEATVTELAYLTDRVLLHEGQQQVYGTQVTRAADGGIVPRELRDPDSLGERRAAVGLPPFAEYIRVFDETWDYRPRLKCPGCDAWAPLTSRKRASRSPLPVPSAGARRR